MFEPFRHRARHLHSLWKVGLWEKVLGVAWSAYGVFGAWRQEFVKPEDQAKLGILQLIPHLSLAWWLFGSATIIIVWMFEASFRVTRTLEDKICAVEGTQALEIIFDTKNPSKKYWARVLVSGPIDKIAPVSYCDEYRVIIRNKSPKTIRNVNVSREANGYFPTLSEDLLFQKDGKRLRDLDPGRAELVNIFWVHAPQAGDAWGETAKAFHGPIKITVSGEDVLPAECEFDYRPDELPALTIREPLKSRALTRA